MVASAPAAWREGGVARPEEALAGFDEATRTAVTGANAARLYRIAR